MTANYTQSISEIVRDRGLARAEKYTVQVVDRLPMLYDLARDAPAFIGTFTVTQSPARWLLASAVVQPYDIPQSPSEVTRDYLMIKFPRKLRRKGAQIDVCREHRPPPLLAVPGHYRDYAYVDLRAAYWSIVRGLGWNVDYWPGRWLARGADMSDYPIPGNKPGRNYLVSIGVSAGMSIWHGGRVTVKPGNPLRNDGLYALVMDILHGLALMARDDFGAVYINTDGYIVPAANADALIGAIADWGLSARVKHDGDAVVRGAGNYDIGRRRSSLPRWKRPSFTDNLREYYPGSYRWLSARVSKLCR